MVTNVLKPVGRKTAHGGAGQGASSTDGALNRAADGPKINSWRGIN